MKRSVLPWFQAPSLALTMMVGAFAETAECGTGDGYGELLGIQVTLTINADGTCRMDVAGMDSEEGVWEKNEDGTLAMDKGTEGEGPCRYRDRNGPEHRAGWRGRLTSPVKRLPRTKSSTISTETTEEELQAQVAGDERHHERHERADEHGGSGVHIIEVKDSKLYLLNLELVRRRWRRFRFRCTFPWMSASSLLTLPVDENTTQMFGVAKLTDGTLLFELVQGDTTMDCLMEAVPEGTQNLLRRNKIISKS